MSVTLIEPPGGDRVLDRAEPGNRGRDLHEQVRSIDALRQQLRLLERRVALVGEIGIDLDRDEAVDALGPVPDRSEDVACALDVLDRECEEHLLRVVRTLELGTELRVVPLPGRECLLEDGRIRRHADDGVLVDEPLQLSRLEHLPRERVDPHAHAVLR